MRGKGGRGRLREAAREGEWKGAGRRWETAREAARTSARPATHAPLDIEARALSFLQTFVCTTLASMPADEYASNVAAASDNRLLADKTLEEEASWRALQ